MSGVKITLKGRKKKDDESEKEIKEKPKRKPRAKKLVEEPDETKKYESEKKSKKSDETEKKIEKSPVQSPREKSPVHSARKKPTKDIRQISMVEHVEKRSMWAGNKDLAQIETYIVEGKSFVLQTVEYSHAFLKIIDEIVVNAIDHAVKTQQVSEIKLSSEEKSGCLEISVYNDGPGIQVKKTKNLAGKEMYSPQLSFSEFLAGSNFDDDDEAERIVGGQNGIGAKLTIVFSKYFIVETYDADAGLYYKQRFVPGKDTIIAEEPEVKAKKMKPFTQITFLPNYEKFKVDSKFNPTVKKLLEARAYQAAAYITDETKKNAKEQKEYRINKSVSIYINDELVPIKTFIDFCNMFTQKNVFETFLTGDTKHKWDVGLALSDGKENSISVVNGVFIQAGGTHIQHIQNLLIENLKPYVEKEIKSSGVRFNKNYITNVVMIFMKGAIESPKFLSQTKEAIKNPISQFKSYMFPPNIWPKIWDEFKDVILDAFLKKQLGAEKTRANRGKLDIYKYEEAENCRNSKLFHKCGLIITEGDSAKAAAVKGLRSGICETFNSSWYGIYPVQGVIVNGLKESKTKTKAEKNDPDAKRIPKGKMVTNEKIKDLIRILGLDFNKKYELNDEGDKEWKTLRYGFVIGLTDQDLDGFNIFGLLATMIMTYWPALVKRGYVRRLNTPLIRAYPIRNKKLPVKEFYTEGEARAWAAEYERQLTEKESEKKKKSKEDKKDKEDKEDKKDKGDEKKSKEIDLTKVKSVRSIYDFQYFKGLGTHDEGKKEVTRMFKNINDKIVTFVYDEEAIMNMFIYYGNESRKRKIALSTGVEEEMPSKLKIPISKQFTINTKLFQRDNIIRKLSSCVDGLVASRRKVLHVAKRITRDKKMKVDGLAGQIVDKGNYHHGQVSLEQTIIRMAQSGPMARNLPLLIPHGEFGSRACGYKDHAASRYISTKINKRLVECLFRSEDDFVLEYEIDDGERYEPKYYVPIIPYALCESIKLPASGWALEIHARHIADILKNVRRMIKGEIKKCQPLGIWAKDFKGHIQEIKNIDDDSDDKVYGYAYVGNYEYDKEDDDVIYITELPPELYSQYYVNGSKDEAKKSKQEKKKAEDRTGMKYNEKVLDCVDYSTDHNVNIKITLKPGAKEEIEENYGNRNFDAFEDFFDLKQNIHNRLNLINENQEVVEYKSYEKIFDDWYKIRKDLYKVRIERETILVDLRIKMLENMQRFSREHETYHITSKTPEEEFIAILTKNKYDIFNHTLLESPEYTPVDMLIKLITWAEHGASYEYILRIPYRDLTREAVERRQKRIDELKKKQKFLDTEKTAVFLGANSWLAELDELEAEIKEGLKTNWLYGENEVVYED